MPTYNIEVRNRDSKDWTVEETGEAKSRRSYLHKEISPDRTRHSELIKSRKAWRCRIEL